MLAQLRLVGGGVAGQHEQRTALGRNQRKRADQREQVLVRTLRRQAERNGIARQSRVARAARALAGARCAPPCRCPGAPRRCARRTCRAARSGRAECCANRRSPDRSGALPAARVHASPGRGCRRAPRESARRSGRERSPRDESARARARCSRDCAANRRPHGPPGAAAAVARQAPIAPGCARLRARSPPAAARPTGRLWRRRPRG